jgi:DNA-binding phage protein
MTVEFAAFEVSDYLNDEEVIAEYLLAAAESDTEVLSCAESDVIKARAANSVREAVKAMEPSPKATPPNHTVAIVSAILILTVVVQVILVKSWT